MNGWKVTIDINGFPMDFGPKTIASNGFSMVLVTKTIGSNGFPMVLGPKTIGTNGFFNGFVVQQSLDTMVFQWFPMVANHWSDDGMVTIHRSGLVVLDHLI